MKTKSSSIIMCLVLMFSLKAYASATTYVSCRSKMLLAMTMSGDLSFTKDTSKDSLEFNELSLNVYESVDKKCKIRISYPSGILKVSIINEKEEKACSIENSSIVALYESGKVKAGGGSYIEDTCGKE